jgi:hypothetical protein
MRGRTRLGLKDRSWEAGWETLSGVMERACGDVPNGVKFWATSNVDFLGENQRGLPDSFDTFSENA